MIIDDDLDYDDDDEDDLPCSDRHLSSWSFAAQERRQHPAEPCPPSSKTPTRPPQQGDPLSSFHLLKSDNPSPITRTPIKDQLSA